MRTPQLDEIEKIRQKLSDVVAEYHGNLLHPIVLQVSQELDRYIVKYQGHGHRELRFGN